MKGLKKITSFILVIAMVVTLCGINNSTADAAVTIFYGKKMKVSVGKSDSIAVKQKGAKFTSSNKKIATVSKKGKVTGKKVGTCKITVKVGKSKKTCTVTVIPDRVVLKSAVLAAENSNAVKVTWNKVKGATGYYVYYSTKKSGGFKKVNVKGGKKTSATINNLTSGNTYYFKVKAYAKAGKKTLTSQSYSKNVLSVKVWKLLWSDEFNYTDKSKILENWSYEEGHGVNGGWGNSEVQHYTNTGNNVSLTGTALVIQPKYEYIESEKKYEYTSARLVTKGKKQFKYGKIEFCAQVPSAQGTWAATWLLGQKNNWPYSGEIDVMETLSNTKTGIFALDRIPQTIHNGKFNGMSTSSGPKNATTTVPGSTTGYHRYGIIWDEKTITFTIDGKKTWTYDPSLYVPQGDGTGNNDIWPYNDYFYLIMNVAIGGTLGGSIVGANGIEKTIINKDEVIGPKGRMIVDWVRVYQ